MNKNLLTYRLLVSMTLLLSQVSGCAVLPAKTISVKKFEPLQTLAQPIRAVTGFDVYSDQSHLYAVLTVNRTAGRQLDMLYLSSDDQGLSWSVPQILDQGNNTGMESTQGNDAQMAAYESKRVIMWQATGEIPGMGAFRTLYSEDDGKTWHPGANPTGTDNDQSHHDLLFDHQQQLHLVWLDDRDENGYQGLRYARSPDLGQHWNSGQTIDGSSCSCCWNRLLLSRDGRLNVLYRDMEFRDMALAASLDNGNHWQRLSTVGEFNWKFEGCPHNGGGLAETASGRLQAVVWTGVEQRAGLYHVYSDTAGKTWSEPMPVAPGSGAFHADIAAAGDDRLLMVWDALGPEGSSVWMAVSTDEGLSWTRPQQLSAPERLASHPRVMSQKAGWTVFWTEKPANAGKRWITAVVE